MTDFNPGFGWRKHPDVPGDDERNYLFDAAADVYWVREEPVPSLPTGPYTVIRVTWKSDSLLDEQELVLHGSMWRDTSNGAASTDELAQYITGFEVLSEPRAVTAKAIANWFDDEAGNAEFNDWRRKAVRTIRREFGVES